ncbi:hypothetical protein [Neisseria sicca]|nr:hypothetical protein [Neisseria sicca]
MGIPSLAARWCGNECFRRPLSDDGSSENGLSDRRGETGMRQS